MDERSTESTVLPRYQVVIDNTGDGYPCRVDESLLAGMERLGRKGIPAGCRGGGCGVCKIRVEAGRVRCERMSRAHVSVDDEARGVVLACRAFPLSDVRLQAISSLARCLRREPSGWGQREPSGGTDARPD